jgi:hypothetical protein
MDLEVLEETLLAPPELVTRDTDRVPSFLEVDYGYHPGRSSGFSAMFHFFALFLIVASSTRFAYLNAVEVIKPRLQPTVDPLYLPLLGGGSEGAGAKGGGSGTPKPASTGLRARSHRGFAYPGRQPLVSAPPMAKLGIQTILRPNLKNPLMLHQVFPLPNLAIAPTAPPEPAKSALKVKSGRLATHQIAKVLRAPKLKLDTAATSKMPELTSHPVMPQGPPPKPTPPAARISDVPVSSRVKEGLLVVNAIPPPPDTLAKVPLGEERSLFAVAQGDTIIADPAAGTKGGGTSKASGNGVPSDNPTGDAIAEVASGGGTAFGPGGEGTGSGSKYGSGKGSGVNTVSEGTGSGRGTTTGPGTGSNAGIALGSGGGAGNSPGSGGFPGISVRDGNYGKGSASIHANVITRRQTSYAMTITSTATSGGGLPDFGVFHNQKVYTVYLDMRASDEDSAPSWTLQYAILQPTDPNAIRIGGLPTPPYAALKQLPELTPELAAICTQKLIVVSGILNTAGKLEQMSVKKTPDSRVNTLLTEALANWIFQPSQIEGNPVPLKILLGIRLGRR